MKCAYCLEEMNDGATVCRVCRRAQPRSFTPGQRELLRLIAGALLVAAVIAACIYIAPIFDDPEIASLVHCMNAKGQPVTEHNIRHELDGLARVTHKDREYNLDVIRRVTDCPR
jgi:hypothetical protein